MLPCSQARAALPCTRVHRYNFRACAPYISRPPSLCRPAGSRGMQVRRWTICTLGRPALRHKPAAGCQRCRAACPPPCARSCGSSCGSKTSRVCADEVCKLYYRGDENYGLGNVLYDVASAAAIAMVLNRSIVYSANSSDRKFLLHCCASLNLGSVEPFEDIFIPVDVNSRRWRPRGGGRGADRSLNSGT